MQVEIIRGDRRFKIEANAPQAAEELISKSGIEIAMPCSGCGRCGKCKIKAEGNISLPTEAERRLLSTDELEEGIRLACETVVTGDAVLTLPETDKIGVLMSGKEPQFEKRSSGKGFGVAVDIGTTTVALYLFDFKSGEQAEHCGRPNSQSAFGADVISRIEKSMAGEEKRLAEFILKDIDLAIENMCAAKKIDSHEITALCLVGNTAMLYLLCGEDPKSIAAAPFIPSRSFGEFTTAGALGLKGVSSETKTYLGRTISAYVGADITAAILSARLDEREKPSLLVDIGTNGEMALSAGGKILCCSTAAGPAFEGVGISKGMQATIGAINRVYYEGEKLVCRSIGNGEPSGICGSGLVDAAAVLISLGAIDDTGRIDEEKADELGILTADGAMPALRLTDCVALTQKDIRQLQLAKAAVCAGAETLLHEAGIGAEALDVLCIAGGFGSYIDIANAEKIGLVPHMAKGSTEILGNAAGTGAYMMLLSSKELEHSERIAQAAETIELSSSVYFMDRYIENMGFEVE